MSSEVTEAGTPVRSTQELGPSEEPTSRRRMLKALGAAAAGAVAGGVLAPTQALAHGGLHQDFNGLDPAIHGNNTDGGPGVEGTSATGPGVRGQSSSTGVHGESSSETGVHGVTTNGAYGVFGESSDTGVHGDGGFIGVEGFSAGGPGVRGESNSGPGVRGESNSGPGVRGDSQTGSGVEGTSAEGVGVHGVVGQSSSPAVLGEHPSLDDGPGVQGKGSFGPGVRGISEFAGVEGISMGFGGVGVMAFSDASFSYALKATTTNRGVAAVLAEATSDFGDGVVAKSANRSGVVGSSDSDTGTGVSGRCVNGTGVFAESSNGYALRVGGKVKFSTAGSGVIPLGQDSVFVSNAAVTTGSHITVTLTGTPGSVISGFPAVLQWVGRQPGGFVIHLTRRVGQATPFTYLIVEPG